MFSLKDINSIDNSYFETVSADAGCIVLKSKNTGHFWAITGTGIGDGVSLMHRHNDTDPWHPQAFYIKCRHNLAGALKAIKSHDADYMKRRTLNGI